MTASSHPKLRLSRKTGIFSVYSEGRSRKLTAKIYIGGNVSLRELGVEDGAEQGFLPFDLVRISELSTGFLLPFASMSGDGRFQLWHLNEDFQFTKQISITRDELALLLHLNLLQRERNVWRKSLPSNLATRISAIHEGLLNLARDLPPSFTDGNAAGGAKRISNALAFALSDIRKPSFSALTSALLEFLKSAPMSADKASDIQRSWEDACRLGLWAGAPRLQPDQCQYEYLREVAAIFIGKDVFYNPFIGVHQICKTARFFRIQGSGGGVGKFCISAHNNIPLVEFRGSGWSSNSSAYQVGDYYMWVSPWAGSSAWSRDYDRFFVDHTTSLNAALNATEPSQVPNALVLNSSDQRNLGHFLWNDISGLFMMRDIPSLADKVDLVALDPGLKGFKGTESYFDLAQRAVAFPEGTLEPSSGEEQERIFEHPRPVIFKSLTFSPELARRLRLYTKSVIEGTSEEAKYTKFSRPGSINIMVNIRAHNKCWNNIHECFSTWLDENPKFSTPLNVVLEYGDDAKSIAKDLDALFSQREISVSHVVNAGVLDLMTTIDRMQLVICPVGSGLVLPTWVWSLPSITHGDPMHMRQLQWWTNVSERVHQSSGEIIHAIADHDIVPVDDKFYADYSVKVEPFVRLLDSVLGTLSPE